MLNISLFPFWVSLLVRICIYIREQAIVFGFVSRGICHHDIPSVLLVRLSYTASIGFVNVIVFFGVGKFIGYFVGSNH